MSSPSESTPKPKKSKKKLILMGTIIVVFALLLKRDAH